MVMPRCLLIVIISLSLSTVAVAALSPRPSPRAALCRMSTPGLLLARKQPKSNSPRSLWRLAGVGAIVGPAVDAVHNQALLSYDVLPISVDLGFSVAKTR